ncbi:MAG TPA: glycosyltransferase family 39 protein [Acidimicrobiales bacterium]
MAGIAAIAVAAFALEMAVSARYGYHRDELYFLQCARHLAFGYVDQPPLTPLAIRLVTLVLGNTLVALRIVPALGLALLVVMTAAMSRELGAGRVGQMLAALATATCGEYIGTEHLFTTTNFDFVFWALTLFLTLRLLVRRDPRYWVAIGVCVGIGGEAKWNIGLLVAALALGFVATPQRQLLKSRFLILGAVLAAGIAAPDLIWQASHGWPNVDVFRALQQSATHNRIVYGPAQVVYTGLALTPLWVAGLVWALRNPAARPFRPVAMASVVVLVLGFVSGGKAYYPGAVFTFLFAAGSVPFGRFVERSGAGARRRVVLAGSVMVVSCALVLVAAIPVLPARTLHRVPLQKINYDLAETVAWPRLVGLVARQYAALPPAERRNTAVLANNYGEAGAVDRYGAGLGLPLAYSGNNSFWLWGPPPAADRSAVAVGIDPGLLRREFAQVRPVASFGNGLGIANDEQGVEIYLARGLRSSWAMSWGAFRHYD